MLRSPKGGALGSGLRYWISQSLTRADQFPVGTLTVNLVGCFLIGLLATWFGQLTNLSEAIRLAILVGFLGGFTTFSAFSLEIANMVERKAFLPAFTYAASSVVVALAAVFVGLWLMRKAYS